MITNYVYPLSQSMAIKSHTNIYYHYVLFSLSSGFSPFWVVSFGFNRYTIDITQNEVIAILSLISHALCYANSAINPLIYNFMSGKYDGCHSFVGA